MVDVSIFMSPYSTTTAARHDHWTMHCRAYVTNKLFTTLYNAQYLLLKDSGAYRPIPNELLSRC
jgi:hypothetical protein